MKAGRIRTPPKWEAELQQLEQSPPAKSSSEVDYASLVAAVDAMDPARFADLDLDAFIQQHSKAAAPR